MQYLVAIAVKLYHMYSTTVHLSAAALSLTICFILIMISEVEGMFVSIQCDRF